MEQVYDNMKAEGTNLHNDKLLRMNRRPTVLGLKPMGQAFHDYGSDFSRHKSSQGRSSDGAPKSSQESARGNWGNNSGRDVPLTLDGDSDDEIDLLSQHYDDGGASGVGSSSMKKSGAKRGGDLPEMAYIDGDFHPYAPGYEPRKEGFPDFKKMKKVDSSAPKPMTIDEGCASSSNPKSSVNTQAQTKAGSSTLNKPFKPPSRADSTSSPLSSAQTITRRTGTRLGMGRGYNLPVERKGNHPLRQQVPNGRELPIRYTPPISIKSSDEEDDTEKVSYTKLRPKPRPLHKGAGAGASSKPVEAKPLQVSSPPASSSQECPRKPAPFPMDLSLEKTTAEPPVEGKGKGKEKAKTAAPFPHLPPLSSRESPPPPRQPPRKVSARIPLPSPLSSPVTSRSSHASYPKTSTSPSPKRPSKKSKGGNNRKGVRVKAGRIVSSCSEPTSSEDEVILSRTPPPPSRKLAAFPMATQVLKSIGYSPGGKRCSEGSDGEDEGYLSKKRRKNPDELLRELLHPHGMEDTELSFMDSDLDPSTLCPWCDEVLPPVPSPHLDALISDARKRSKKDPRPGNALGLQADVTVFVQICQRHCFESVQVPLAEKNGWPTSIDWGRLGERVRRLERQLERVVSDVDEEFSFTSGRGSRADRAEDKRSRDRDGDEGEDEAFQKRRPRKGCTFWKDVVRDIKKQGSRQTAGVRGQLSSFNKTQPGYYGELGYVIIHQTIYDLFPPETFPPDSTLPLTPTEFIQLVLVPEAAVALIMQDLDQSRKQAIHTLRESAEYGVAMFPDDHGHAANEAGEDIVRKRAMARRKLIESEGEDDIDGSGFGFGFRGDVERPLSDREEMDHPMELVDSEEEMWRQCGDVYFPLSTPPDPPSPRNQQASPRKEKAPLVGRDKPGVPTTRSKTSKKAVVRSGSEADRPGPARNTRSKSREIIEVSDSPSSTSGVTSNLPRHDQTTRTRRAKRTNKKSSTSLSDVAVDPSSHIDLCDSTEAESDASDITGENTQVTPRPRRRKAKLGEKGDSKGTETAVSGSSQPLAPTSSAIEVRFALDGKHQVLERGSGRVVVQGSDVDATPKAKVPVSRSSSGNYGRIAGAGSRSQTRRNPSDTLRREQPKGSWVRNMAMEAASSGDEWWNSG